MDGVRQQAGGALRLAEEKVHGVDAMRGDVVERAAAGKRRIGEPFAARNFKPAVAVGLSQQRPADGAFGDELFGADELGIETAVVGNAEKSARMRAPSATMLLACGKIHGHGLFAEHVLARAQGRDGGARMEGDRQRDVNGIDGRVGDGFLDRSATSARRDTPRPWRESRVTNP